MYGPFFHGGNTGSNPVGDANKIKDLLENPFFSDRLFPIIRRMLGEPETSRMILNWRVRCKSPPRAGPPPSRLPSRKQDRGSGCLLDSSARRQQILGLVSSLLADRRPALHPLPVVLHFLAPHIAPLCAPKYGGVLDRVSSGLAGFHHCRKKSADFFIVNIPCLLLHPSS